MKKVILFLVAVILFAANVNAQEVHGVETKLVCTYDCNPDGSWDNWNDNGVTKYPCFSYEFTNRNSIPVSVEVELHGVDDKDIIMATKSFVLESGESYVFKVSSKGVAKYIDHNYFYVTYKAYKLL